MVMKGAPHCVHRGGSLLQKSGEVCPLREAKLRKNGWRRREKELNRGMEETDGVGRDGVRHTGGRERRRESGERGTQMYGGSVEKMDRWMKGKEQ